MNTVLSLLCEGFLLSVRMGMYAVAISVPALLLSLLFRRLRAPQWVSFLLWGMIAFRLVCPLALSSSLSVFNLGFLQDYASRVPEAFRNGRVGEYSVAVDITRCDAYSKFAGEKNLSTLLSAGCISFEEYVNSLDDDSSVPKAKLLKILSERGVAK